MEWNRHRDPPPERHAASWIWTFAIRISPRSADAIGRDAARILGYVHVVSGRSTFCIEGREGIPSSDIVPAPAERGYVPSLHQVPPALRPSIFAEGLEHLLQLP